jgi:hypothetical protein
MVDSRSTPTMMMTTIISDRHEPKIYVDASQPATLRRAGGSVRRFTILTTIVFAFAFSADSRAATPRVINIEFLQAEIDPSNVQWLSGLACRNYDRIVHVDLSISWPDKDTDAETAGFERLVFWNSEAEFLFPKGTYFFLHGSWIVKGYFIVRSGGVHQGIVSDAFEKIDDATVMLNPNVQENQIKSANCP